MQAHKEIDWSFKDGKALRHSSRTVQRILGFLVLGELLCSACAGMTGSTNFITIPVDKKIIVEPVAEVRVASVEIEPNAAFLRAVGSYAMGKFDSDDLKVLRTSLQNSIFSLMSSVQTDHSNKLDLHVLLRHHMVAHSNNEGGVLAAVAWCLVNEKGVVTFHEGFFASDSGRHTVTLGAIKDAVNESIIRRIVETVAQVASLKQQHGIQYGHFPRTYTTYREALADLPQSLSSTVLFIPTIGPEKIDWGWPADATVDIDWEPYLRGVRDAHQHSQAQTDRSANHTP